jgi:hypothetical protein
VTAAACAEWEGVFGCKDKLLGGRLSVNLQRKHLDYRKSISMGGSSQLSIRGSCTQTQARPGSPCGLRLRLRLFLRGGHGRAGANPSRPHRACFRWRPRQAGGWATTVGVVMEPIHNTEAMQAAGLPGTNAFDIRTKIPIAPALRAEVRRPTKAPQPPSPPAEPANG